MEGRGASEREEPAFSTAPPSAPASVSVMEKARDAARWRSNDDLWLDHVSLSDADAEWLAPVKRLTLWSVKLPDGLLPSLPNLCYLDVRGGSGTSLAFLSGCTGLRYLQINQVRGMVDLALLPEVLSLEFLSLYGLPKVLGLPSLAQLSRLRRVELGSLKGLTGLTGLHDAPGLQELLLIRAVAVAEGDAERLAVHPTLRQFDWFGEDVPVRVWSPFRDTVGKPKAPALHAAEWFEQRGGL